MEAASSNGSSSITVFAVSVGGFTKRPYGHQGVTDTFIIAVVQQQTSPLPPIPE
jgi:hypothetical protein